MQLVNLYPFRRFGSNIFFHGPRNKKQIALTFDDGPTEQTLKILNILTKYKAKATFFVMGKKVKKYPNVLGKVVKQGSEIGNHTYNHGRCVFISKKRIREQIARTNYELTRRGFQTNVFRPPDGRFGLNLVSILEDLGMKGIIWDTEPKDWTRPGVRKVVSRILNRAKSGSIVCLHDCTSEDRLNEDIIKILETVVPQLKKEGYDLVTVSKILK